MPSLSPIEAAVSASAVRPLCVDLDGTLVKSDTLHDSLLVLACSRPAVLPALFRSLFHGKAAFKACVTSAVTLDVTHLPYNQALLEYLRAEHARGRKIYLATGADIRLARRVADHLGIFVGVLGSDGATNLTGRNKLETLRDHIPSGVFDYIGNDTPDLPLLAHSSEPMTANPTLRLRVALRSKGIRPVRVFREYKPMLPCLLKAARIHQWAKNALIFLPVLLAHDVRTAPLMAATLAFLSFSFAASATYIVNDLLDIEADRRHRGKHARPFASGDLSPVQGVAMIAVFAAIAVMTARLVPAGFALWLLVYIGSSLAYTAFLKRVPLVDVLVLAGLYTLRLLAGSAATFIPISHWLAGFSLFLFLSLAIVKRFAELENLRARGVEPRNRRGYFLADLEQLRAFGTASAYAAVVIFAIYISNSDVTLLYRNAGRLWLVVPFIILWLNRVWLLASRGELNEDPVVFAITDRVSVLIGIAVAVVVYLAV